MKPNIIKVLQITGYALSIVGTIVSGIATDRKTKATLAELVKEELSKSK